MTSLARTFEALADPARRGVVELLRARPHRASDLAELLGLSRPAMSRHLKVLRASGLVTPANDDADLRARVYRLRPEPFAELKEWVHEIERFWTLELDAFKAHAERARGKRR
jgi:DNA-binding transcriptional ArsR family regulator